MGSGRVTQVLKGLSVVAALFGAAEVSAADLRAKRLPPEAVPVVPETQLIDFIFGARIQSDYNFRGITQSDHRESGQSYFEAQYLDNLFYTGFATYKVDLPTRPSMEFDLTAGIRPKWGPLNFDFGVIYYNYPGERRLIDPATGGDLSVSNADFLEFAGKVSYTYQDALTLGANVFYTSNFTGLHADGTYASGTAKYLIPTDFVGMEGFSISAEFGHYFLGRTSPRYLSVNLPDYNYGNVGLSYTWKALTLDVRYHNTDLSKAECFTITGDPRGIFTGSGRSNWCGDAVIATLSVDFQASKLLEQLGMETAAVPK